jgi:hypothetical protein
MMIFPFLSKQGGIQMPPRIEKFKFGSITIDGKTYTSDVIIRPDGEVKKRKKKLSKDVYGTSHTISLEEAKHVFKKSAKTLIIGGGQFGRVKLSAEATDYLAKKGCEVTLLPTPKAIQAWNETEYETIGLFHITC